MNSWILVLSLACLASACGNAFQIYLLRSIKKKPVKQSIELQEFLVDLMSGGGMVAVRRVDPEDFILRSPKSR